MADNQRGRKGQNSNQDMNKGNLADSGRNRQEQQTQNIGNTQSGSQKGTQSDMGQRSGSTGNPDNSRNRENR